MKTAIYRTGSMSVGVHSYDTLMHWEEFDDRRPVGHVSREESLFAAPDIQGGHHWMGYVSRKTERCFAFNEIIVESDNVRVYSVDDYNRVTDHGGYPYPSDIEYINSYWDTSMSLTDWLGEVGQDPHGQWEVLLPVSEVISSRTLTYEEIRELYLEEGMEDEIMDLDYISSQLEDGLAAFAS